MSAAQALTAAAAALPKVEAAQGSRCQAGRCSSEACVVVKGHLAALVVVADVWIEVTLVGSTHQAATQADEGGVGIDEVALCAAATSADTCTGELSTIMKGKGRKGVWW